MLERVVHRYVLQSAPVRAESPASAAPNQCCWRDSKRHTGMFHRGAAMVRIDVDTSTHSPRVCLGRAAGPDERATHLVWKSTDSYGVAARQLVVGEMLEALRAG